MPLPQSEALLLGAHFCTQCNGRGYRVVWHKAKREHRRVCHCSWRSIFRLCLGKWRAIRHKLVDGGMSHPHWSGYSWSRPGEEYLADFEIVIKRALTPEQYRVFRLHFLESMGWRNVIERLHLPDDRGTYWNEVKRIEIAAGRALRLAEPYPLYPIDDYFVTRMGVLEC